MTQPQTMQTGNRVGCAAAGVVYVEVVSALSKSRQRNNQFVFRELLGADTTRTYTTPTDGVAKACSPQAHRGCVIGLEAARLSSPPQSSSSPSFAPERRRRPLPASRVRDVHPRECGASSLWLEVPRA